MWRPSSLGAYAAGVIPFRARLCLHCLLPFVSTFSVKCCGPSIDIYDKTCDPRTLSGFLTGWQTRPRTFNLGGLSIRNARVRATLRCGRLPTHGFSRPGCNWCYRDNRCGDRARIFEYGKCCCGGRSLRLRWWTGGPVYVFDIRHAGLRNSTICSLIRRRGSGFDLPRCGITLSS